MRKVVYISHPITKGDTLANIGRSMRVWEHLFNQGFSAICPGWSGFQHMMTEHTWEEWLDYDKALVAKSDAVLRVAGESKGADQECQWAEEWGIPVFHSIPDLMKWAHGQNKQSSEGGPVRTAHLEEASNDSSGD